MMSFSIVAFMLIVAAHGKLPPASFLEVSSDLDTSALARRVENVGQLAATEQFAAQAQQQALVALEQEQEHLSARMDAMEARQVAAKHGSEQEDPLFYLCSSKTDGTCKVYDCDKERGMAVCNMGSCVCQPGICADGHGRCLSDKPARKMPGLYKIHARKMKGLYMYMDENGVNFKQVSKEHLGEDVTEHNSDIHWHVVVNNDNTLMLWTDKYGASNFLSVKDINLDKNDDDPAWRAAHQPFSYPQATSFEIYGDIMQEIFLKHTHTKRWIHPTPAWNTWFASNKVQGVKDFPGEEAALIFDPPLKDITLLKASAQHCLPLLPFLLIFGAVFA